MGSDHDQSGPAESEFAVRLAVIKDIAQAMRDPQSPGDIIRAYRGRRLRDHAERRLCHRRQPVWARDDLWVVSAGP